MLPSRFLSSTSLVALAALGAACSDDAACEPGPGVAPDDGITGVAEDTTIVYGDLAAAANNDCPSDGTPDGVISLTIGGAQITPAGAAVISFCLPRPDLITPGTAFSLEPDRHPALTTDRVHVIDVQAALPSGCRWTHDPDDPPSGTATFEGFCDDGTDAAGFALTLDGTIPVTETCAGLPDRALTVTLAGTVSVRAGEL